MKNCKAWKNIKNQQGQMVMTAVVGISLVLLSLFTFYTLFWQQHLAGNSQIREAYNLLDTMEQAAKDIQGRWDKAVAQSGYGASLTTIQGNFAAIALPNSSVCGACPSAGGQPVLCYANPTNSSSPYCFYNGGTTTARLDLKLIIHNEKKPTLIEKTVDRVVLFFRPLSKVHIAEESALAGMPGPTRNDNLGAVPACPGAAASCMTCGNGNQAVCVNIYACPAAFLGCRNFNGSLGQALFSQQFYLIPPNATNK